MDIPKAQKAAGPLPLLADSVAKVSSDQALTTQQTVRLI